MTFLPALAAIALSTVVAVSSNPVEAKTCEEPDNVSFVQGTRHCLAIETFTSASRADTLVVTLHGALSRGGTADYMVRFARAVSALGVSTVAMMHPGYTGAGRTSSGRPARDRHRDDNYRKREVDSIASALETLKTHHGAKRLILVGHSLGSIISGVILGRHPDLADAALLVACPCNLDSWRRSRGRKRLAFAESPHRHLKKVAPDTTIVALTGSEDNNTLPSNAQDYVARAKKRGARREVRARTRCGPWLLPASGGRHSRRRFRHAGARRSRTAAPAPMRDWRLPLRRRARSQPPWSTFTQCLRIFGSGPRIRLRFRPGWRRSGAGTTTRGRSTRGSSITGAHSNQSSFWKRSKVRTSTGCGSRMRASSSGTHATEPECRGHSGRHRSDCAGISRSGRAGRDICGTVVPHNRPIFKRNQETDRVSASCGNDPP